MTFLQGPVPWLSVAKLCDTVTTRTQITMLVGSYTVFLCTPAHPEQRAAAQGKLGQPFTVKIQDSESPRDKAEYTKKQIQKKMSKTNRTHPHTNANP